MQALSDQTNPAFALIASWDGRSVRSDPRAAPTGSRRLLQVQNRLNSDAVADLVAAYQAGATLKDLSTQFQIARTTIMAHLNRAGTPRRRPILGPEQVEQAARLYDEGCSLARLADRFHVEAGTVGSALRKAGVSIRPRRGWPYPQP